MGKLPLLTERIAEDDYRKVRVKAAELGIPISVVVRELLARWVAGELKTEGEVDQGD